MASTWVYLARHGEVLHAAEGASSGTRTSPCRPGASLRRPRSGTSLGAEPIEAVYASDLLRARQSAAPLAAARGTSVVSVPALREMAMGRWEGLTFAEIHARDPGALRPVARRSLRVAVPGG